jgi:hypothetical protein
MFSRNVIPIQPEMKKYIMESTEKSMEKYIKQKQFQEQTNKATNKGNKRFRNISV